MPAETSLAYYDPARDYQTGLQRASRPGPALTSDRRAIAAALDAATAKALAADRLRGCGRPGARPSCTSGWSRLGLRAGGQVRDRRSPGALADLALDARPDGAHAGADRRTRGRAGHRRAKRTPGGRSASRTCCTGRHRCSLLDLPLSHDEPAVRPRLLAAAAGAEAGWRRAELIASFDGGCELDGGRNDRRAGRPRHRARSARGRGLRADRRARPGRGRAAERVDVAREPERLGARRRRQPRAARRGTDPVRTCRAARRPALPALPPAARPARDGMGRRPARARASGSC